MNTGPHSPASATLAAEMRKAAAGRYYSLGMERPDIPGLPIAQLHRARRLSFRGRGLESRWAGLLGPAPHKRNDRLACSVLQRFGDGVGKVPNLSNTLAGQDAQRRPNVLAWIKGRRACLSLLADWRRLDKTVGYGRSQIAELGEQRPCGMGHGYKFQHQPITPVRRLAGCDADARSSCGETSGHKVCRRNVVGTTETYRGRRGVGNGGVYMTPVSRPRNPLPCGAGCNRDSRSSARPASLFYRPKPRRRAAFSWAAAASRACEPFEVSRVTGLTNARYADGRSAPTRMPQSFPLVPA